MLSEQNDDNILCLHNKQILSNNYFNKRRQSIFQLFYIFLSLKECLMLRFIVSEMVHNYFSEGTITFPSSYDRHITYTHIHPTTFSTIFMLILLEHFPQHLNNLLHFHSKQIYYKIWCLGIPAFPFEIRIVRKSLISSTPPHNKYSKNMYLKWLFKIRFYKYLQ